MSDTDEFMRDLMHPDPRVVLRAVLALAGYPLHEQGTTGIGYVVTHGNATDEYHVMWYGQRGAEYSTERTEECESKLRDIHTFLGVSRWTVGHRGQGSIEFPALPITRKQIMVLHSRTMSNLLPGVPDETETLRRQLDIAREALRQSQGISQHALAHDRDLRLGRNGELKVQLTDRHNLLAQQLQAIAEVAQIGLDQSA